MPEPTELCEPMVVVPKSNGKIHICVDLTRLNNAVQRERQMLPSVEHTLGQMTDAKVFSKIDANAGFHQIVFDDEYSLLATFITTFVRYYYKRLPYQLLARTLPEESSRNT